MSKITDTVRSLAEPVAAENGCTVWDVEYVREAGQNYLRVFIDCDEGVSIDQCEKVSRTLDPILDEHDPVPDSYIFEVSSAGLERSLKRPSDFEKYIGSQVEVRLYKAKDGRKEFVGVIVGYNDGAVTVNCAGNEITFEKNEVANVRLRVNIGG